MKKYFILALGVLFLAITSYGQRQIVVFENFDKADSIKLTATPAGSWKINSQYYVSSPNSYRATVPNMLGDSVILQTAPYNFVGINHIQLRFYHICKTAKEDILRVEYRVANSTKWNPVPWETYQGSAANYALTGGFNAASYSQWRSDDNLVSPSQSWWKEEIFDLSTDAIGNVVEFRFVLKRGSVQGTQIAYGWLLDNFEIITSDEELTPPVVAFINPVPRDTVYSVGPYEINAKVKTATTAPIKNPHLKYTATNNGTHIVTDSILMVNVSGDSLWRATIPAFVAGTQVSYSITGIDAFENYLNIHSEYIIQQYIITIEGTTEDIIIGTGKNQRTFTAPTALTSNYSWSRQLYMSKEIDTLNGAGGLITELAWELEWVGSSPVTMKNQTCWMKAVNDTVLTPGAYIDPFEDGGTQVWKGNFMLSNVAGWNSITLDEPFYLPPGMSLLIYWNGEHGTAPGNSWTWSNTLTNVNRTIYLEQSTGFPDAGVGGALTNQRPNLKLHKQAITSQDNSVALYSIDMQDVTIVSSALQVPIVVTIKNMGSQPLDSTVISYSLNGTAPQSYIWKSNPGMLWDFNAQDTIGYYHPKLNDYDTLVIWTSMPNNQYDILTWDDTLTKIIYGEADITLHFVDAVADTVYLTGPYTIKAQIQSRSGTPISNVLLNTTATSNGSTTYNSILPMVFDAADNLWKATIPNLPAGNTVDYSITLTDIRNNILTVSEQYYIKEAAGGEIVGYAYFAPQDTANGNTTNPNFPLPVNQATSWSRMLYINSELVGDINHSQPNMIAKIAIYNRSSDVTCTRSKIKIYMRSTPATTNADAVYIDPIDDGAILVYNGTLTTQLSWNEITLDKSFYLPAEDNLMIYIQDSSGNTCSSISWPVFPISSNRAVFRAGTGNIYAAASLPFIRLALESVIQRDTNSVALVSIDSPVEDVLPSNIAVPVKVSIKNKGASDLTSCQIGWSVNGVDSPFVQYTRTLLEGFTDTITIGNLIPSVDKPDTIKIWVSMPNGKIDSVTYDDTLGKTIFGCQNIMSGDYRVGPSPSAVMSSIERPLARIKNCGISGKVTLWLEDYIFPESVDLSQIANSMTASDTLEIVSLSGNHANVIIRPVVGNGISLANNTNIIIRGITIDATQANTHGVQFMDACTNVVIRDCKIMAQATSTQMHGIHKASGATGILNNIYILNDTIEGGYTGISLNGANGNTSAYGTKIIIDSNIIQNHYYYGINIQYTDFTISYNEIKNKISGGNTSWTGINVSYCNGSIIGNRIIQREAATPGGIAVQNYNYYLASDDPVKKLIANNEIIIKATATQNGIYLNTNSYASVLNNSVYVQGPAGAARGIYLLTAVNATVKNNNIVMGSSTAYPICISSASNVDKYDIDYNNMCGTYVGNVGGNAAGNKTTIEQWQYTVGSDKHSVKKVPIFEDTNSSLKLKNYDPKLLCNVLPLVKEDINKDTRIGKTTMGCYGNYPLQENGLLAEIVGLQDEVTANQPDSIRVTLLNTGIDTIKSVNLSWTINGVPQNAGGTNFTVSLATGELDTITVSELLYSKDTITVTVWINHVNESGVKDGSPADDTISVSTYLCRGNINGPIPVGKTRELTSIDAAFNRLVTCGINGDVTFVLDSGLYEENWDFSDLGNIMGGYTLTITSAADSVEDVTLRPSSGMGIRLSNTRNLILKGITIDALTAGAHGIQFLSACNNIVIRDCKIKAINTTATVGTASAIYKATSTGLLDSIFIIHNIIEGGAAGVYLSGGTASSASSVYGSNIVVDSNIIQSQNAYGIYLHTVTFTSAYNRIYSRESVATAADWSGIYLYYCNGSVVSNRIIQKGLAKPYGIRVNQYFNWFLTQSPGLIANNEIILNTDAQYYGMYFSYANANVLNNSIYISGTSTAATAARGIHLNYSANCKFIIKNNNIVMKAYDAWPIYVGSVTNITTLYQFDYNNMYAPQYVANAGGNITNISSWQNLVKTDTHSVSVLPEFIDVTSNLKIKTYNDSLSCPLYPGITTDIDGKVRPSLTTIGASQIEFGQDMMLMEVANWKGDLIEKQVVDVSVEALNLGTTPITKATLGWSVNGDIKPSVTWTPSQALTPFEQRNIAIGQFPVMAGTDKYNLTVWIETINNEADTVHANDTVRASANVQPLAEFKTPLVPDTITDLSFDVHTLIRSFTGAPAKAPELNLVIINEGLVLYDTVAMVPDNSDMWVAHVWQAYSNSQIIYSLTVSDTIGNTVTLTDSVFLKYVDGSGVIYDYENNLSLLSITAPVNVMGDICTPDYSPVMVSMKNFGKRDYNYSIDPVTINLEIDGALLFDTMIVVDNGILKSGLIDTIELSEMLPVYPQGQYNITVWISSSLDTVHLDDTLRFAYISERISLPIDEDFSSAESMALVFTTTGTTPDVWTIVAQGTGTDTVVKPVYGTGMISFGGAKGAMSNLSTRQLRLQGTRLPVLEFWYFHDTIEADDYTDVRIVLDENGNYIPLKSLTKHDTAYGWKHYAIPLEDYIYGTCISILFESMTKSEQNTGVQYIDRIRITSQQDLELSDLTLAGLSVCNLSSNALKVKRTTTTNQIIDFSKYSTSIQIDITGTVNYSFNYPLTDVILGDTFDVITIKSNINFIPGTYNVKAYLTSPVDAYHTNDTAKTTIVINPSLSLVVTHNTGGTNNCASANTTIQQQVIVKNTGNMDLPGIKLDMDVSSASYAFSETTSIPQTLSPGDSVIYNFDAYTVPWDANYYVGVVASLGCDSMLVHAASGVTECVNIKDLYLESIDNPLPGEIDKVGDPVNVAVTLKNRYDLSVFPNVRISVLVEDSKEQRRAFFTETGPTVGISSTADYTFRNAYTVPNDTVYYLTVYIDSYDDYTSDDTIRIKRITDYINTIEGIQGVNISMDQNIPNPADNSTMITYNIPESGEVTFRIHSVTGQLLYNKVVQSESGTNSIEINTSGLSAGLYVYSMEYKGQRITKRMSIKR